MSTCEEECEGPKSDQEWLTWSALFVLIIVCAGYIGLDVTHII